MKFLFVADPLKTFNIKKDSTFTMMRESQKRGHEVWSCETSDLQWQSGQAVSAHVQQLQLTGDDSVWHAVLQSQLLDR